ncbi:MAG: ABC transporter permease [Gemmatimonadetes bacterium]|nr:ABC transporter permease [Gemmatimonadota bacterium]
MRKIWAVIRREFLERVRSKWFIIGTVLGPVLMFGIIAIPILVGERGGNRTVAVLDATTTGFGERLTGMLNGVGTVIAQRVITDAPSLEDAAASLARRVELEAIDGFIIVTDAVVDDGRAEYRGRNVTSLTDMQTLQVILRNAVFSERLRREGVDPSLVARARIPVNLTTKKIRDGKVTEESGEASFFLAYAMWFLLYIAILLYGIQVMGSVVEEKTTRVIEVLTSSLRPFQLLAGKILGVGAVGLLQLGIWVGFGKLMLDQRVRVASLLGQGEEAAALANLSLPEVSFMTIAVFLAYFLLGYFLYAAMFAAVAAMVNSEAEARQAQTPVVMLLVIPTVLMIGILNNPDGSMAVALSLIPFTSPIGMPVRWAATPIPLTELAGSLAILVATVVAITWIAGRIYRVGILMYGKKPGIRELIRWVRG